MRRAPAALLALLVLLAGCGSAGEATETYSPAPVPGTPSPSTTATLPLPPGVNESGVVDPATLAAEHRAALRNRTYRMVLVIERATQNAGVTRTRVVVRRGANATLVRSTTVTTSERSSRVVYTDDRGRWVRCSGGNCSGGRTNPSTVAVDTLTRVLANADTELAGRVRHDGRLHHRLVADRPGFEPTRPGGVIQVANYTGELLVRPAGLVSVMRVRYVLSDGLARTDVAVTLRYTDLDDTTVRRPAWVDGDDDRA